MDWAKILLFLRSITSSPLSITRNTEVTTHTFPEPLSWTQRSGCATSGNELLHRTTSHLSIVEATCRLTSSMLITTIQFCTLGVNQSRYDIERFLYCPKWSNVKFLIDLRKKSISSQWIRTFMELKCRRTFQPAAQIYNSPRTFKWPLWYWWIIYVVLQSLWMNEITVTLDASITGQNKIKVRSMFAIDCASVQDTNM